MYSPSSSMKRRWPSLRLLLLLQSRCCTANMHEVTLSATTTASIIHGQENVWVWVWGTSTFATLHCYRRPLSIVPSSLHVGRWRGISWLVHRHRLWCKVLRSIVWNQAIILHLAIVQWRAVVLWSEVLGWKFCGPCCLENLRPPDPRGRRVPLDSRLESASHSRRPGSVERDQRSSHCPQSALRYSWTPRSADRSYGPVWLLVWQQGLDLWVAQPVDTSRQFWHDEPVHSMWWVVCALHGYEFRVLTHW